MKKITWEDFEVKSKNFQNDFENLCRLFFKYYFVKNPYANLTGISNNPGIETDPIEVEGVRIGFQAKYFTGNINYIDILDSCITTKEYYSQKIDRIIIFSNKDINMNTKTMNEAKKIMKEDNIEILSFCNNNILDIIDTLNAYEKLKCLYFNKIFIPPGWFEKRLNDELNLLAPRYLKNFHVSDLDIETYFEIIYRTEDMFQRLSTMLLEWEKDVKKISIEKGLQKCLEDKVLSLKMPERSKILEVLNWYKLFEEERILVNLTIQSLEDKMHCTEKNEYDKYKNEYYNYSKTLSLIDKIDLKNDQYFSLLTTNVFIIEGEAGIGKSHLLGYVAETQSNKHHRTILMLGQKFIYDSDPEKQILSYLGLQEATLEEFFDALEAKGELDDSVTVILIDAINECSKFNIWKNFLPKLIDMVQTKKYIRLVLSIRTTYKEIVFNDYVQNQIKTNRIALIRHKGFELVLNDAIPYFFKVYKIPITISAYMNEFVNPLFLMTYCKGYDRNSENYGSTNIFQWYNNFINNEESKIKEQKEISSKYSYSKKILEIIGIYFVENIVRCIPYDTLVDSTKSIPNVDVFIDGFLKSEALISYCDFRGIEQVYLNFERFSDFIIAKTFIDKTSNEGELFEIIEKTIFAVDNGGNLKNYTYIGVFAALSILAKEKYNIEIIDAVQLIDKNAHRDYIKNQIIYEYLEIYKYRSDNEIDLKLYKDKIAPYILTKDIFENLLSLLINMAVRNNDLNAEYLSAWLMDLSLSKRDYYWTININSLYIEGQRIYNVIQYVLDGNYCSLKEKYLYAKLLIWFFSSSNRKLKDKASRALIVLLNDDILMMIKLLDNFIEVNDPYIISRLFGCIYGSLLRIEKNKINKVNISYLANKVNELIFNKEKVYEDILLRDYALNLIEYIASLGLKIDFDINKCKPPYNGNKIKRVPIKELEKLYPKQLYGEAEQWFGTTAIKSSMAPEYTKSDFYGMYGDFGRYVFGSALSNFKGLNFDVIYSYAYKYIASNLGYDNNLFSEYDKNIGYGRMRGASYLERIGKKYQWIAMYHVLALVSDNHKFNEKYVDAPYIYKGTWNPCVRDFDPTLSLNSYEDKRDYGIYLNREEFDQWNLTDSNWADNKKGMFDFKKLIEIKDNNEEEWIALRFSFTDKSYKEYEQPNQSIWKSTTACLIKKQEKNNFILKIKEKNFWGRWLGGAEVVDNYTTFLHEYCWSPSYRDTNNFEYEEVKIEVGQKIVKKKYKEHSFASFPKQFLELFDHDETTEKIKMAILEENSIKLEKEYEEIEKIYENIGKIIPLYNSYLWEEPYDFGKDETLSILLPSDLLVNRLGLEQKNDGVWYMNDELVCADFSFMKGSNIEGLYIKKNVLNYFLNVLDCDVVWIGMGEKNTIYETMNEKNDFSNLSSLVYKDDKDDMIEINHVNKR